MSWVSGGGAYYVKSVAGSPGLNTGVWGAYLVPSVSSSSVPASTMTSSSSSSTPVS